MFAIIVRPELLKYQFHLSILKILYSSGCTNCRLFENYNIIINIIIIYII